MNDLQQLLKKHDPAADAALLPGEEQRLRLALNAPPPPRRISFRAAGAFATMALVALFLVALWGAAPRESQPAPMHAPVTADRTREVQVTTPGGTRVIWVFNDDFRM